MCAHDGRRAPAFALPPAGRALIRMCGADQEGIWGQGIGCGPNQEVVVNFLDLSGVSLGVEMHQAEVDSVAVVDLPRIKVVSRGGARDQVPDPRRDDGCAALGEYYAEIVEGHWFPITGCRGRGAPLSFSPQSEEGAYWVSWGVPPRAPSSDQYVPSSAYWVSWGEGKGESSAVGGAIPQAGA